MSEHYQFLDELLDEAGGKFRLLQIADFCERAELRLAVEASLPRTDPRHPKGFELDQQFREYGIYWGGYRYPVDLDSLKTPLHLLSLLAHIGGKTWEGMNGRHVAALIESVCREQGWALHTPGTGLTPRDSPADAERAKLTPQLRYSVLKRDGFRCRACGAGIEQGAFLQIDHRVPIARGGTTVFENLQALCATCNWGKGHTK